MNSIVPVSEGDIPAIDAEAARVAPADESNVTVCPVRPPSLLVAPSDIEKIAEKNGLIFKRQFEAGDHHYGLVFEFPI